MSQAYDFQESSEYAPAYIGELLLQKIVPTENDKSSFGAAAAELVERVTAIDIGVVRSRFLK